MSELYDCVRKNATVTVDESEFVDLTIFRVSKKGGDKETSLELVKKEFPHWLDGKEHNFLKVGGEIGDQKIGLLTIGLGHLLGVWSALSPDTIMPSMPGDMKMAMAVNGMVSLQFIPVKSKNDQKIYYKPTPCVNIGGALMAVYKPEILEYPHKNED